MTHILLVDDDHLVRKSLTRAFSSAGLDNLLEAPSGEEAIEILRQQEVGVIVLDLNMPGMGGLKLLEQIQYDFPEVSTIVLTASDDANTAVRCMQAGALNFIVKPTKPRLLIEQVRRAIEIYESKTVSEAMRQVVLTGSHPVESRADDPVFASEPMKRIIAYLGLVAPSKQPVLITGETGVGKEMVAQQVHRLSGREGELVTINVAGLDEQLFSDTLFGHLPGAYTGADKMRAGLIDKAQNGTLFLDEIGDMDVTSQVKLLRVLQSGEYYQLGSERVRYTNARIVVATNQDLNQLQVQGKFRNDLYYRLNTHRVHIPPLRERPEAIPPLLDRFLREAAEEMGKTTPTYPPELLPLLRSYAFPGNVRELKSMVHDAVAQHERGVLSLATFRRVVGSKGGNGLQPPAGAAPEAGESRPEGSFVAAEQHLPTLEEATDALVREALRRAENNQRTAASMLGISRQALQRRIQRLSTD